mgnify:CR=1 FL=1
MDLQMQSIRNAKDAIAAELGVFPEFDENGTILSVSETR